MKLAFFLPLIASISAMELGHVSSNVLARDLTSTGDALSAFKSPLEKREPLYCCPVAGQSWTAGPTAEALVAAESFGKAGWQTITQANTCVVRYSWNHLCVTICSGDEDSLVTSSRIGDLVNFIASYCSGNGNTCGQVFDETDTPPFDTSYNVIVNYC